MRISIFGKMIGKASPRSAQRGEGQGEGFEKVPPLPGPLLHKCVEEREMATAD